MARIAEPIIIHKRGNSFQFTLNSTCGLPHRVCAEWQRRSFKTLPDELFLYRNPSSLLHLWIFCIYMQKIPIDGRAFRVCKV
jgi:hypothetical protein